MVLLISDLFTGFLALFGLLALADVKGMLGNPPQNLDSGTMDLIAVFELLFVVTFAATAGVFSRAPWARAVTYTAGVALSLTCLGLVLAIPIFIAAARAPLGPTPSPYTLPA